VTFDSNACTPTPPRVNIQLYRIAIHKVITICPSRGLNTIPQKSRGPTTTEQFGYMRSPAMPETWLEIS
jgi:hypothetical protein